MAPKPLDAKLYAHEYLHHNNGFPALEIYALGLIALKNPAALKLVDGKFRQALRFQVATLLKDSALQDGR